MKDAAAASIWGARAANGVLVLTTKKGNRHQRARISASVGFHIKDKPDFHKTYGVLEAPGTIEWERVLFEQGRYDQMENSSQYPPLTEAVELFILQRDGLLTADGFQDEIQALSRNSLSREAADHLYRTGYGQQYNLALRGGSETVTYSLSAGFDQNPSNVIANEHGRLTLNANNTFRIKKKLTLGTSVRYANNTARNNGIGLTSFLNSPAYTRLANEDGKALPVLSDYRVSYLAEAEQEGLLNWQYRPLEEVGLNNFVNRNQDLILGSYIQYSPITYLNLNLNYQYQQVTIRQRKQYHENSYFTRDLVNRFTQTDGNRVINEGAILDDLSEKLSTHNLRLQLNYSNKILNDRQLDFLIGAEVRERLSEGSGFRLYGYNDRILTAQSDVDFASRFPVRPASSLRIPMGYNNRLSGTIDRYFSVYANVGFALTDDLQLSGSLRRDASNLFGVRENQRWTPLWSAGVAWQALDGAQSGFRWVNDLRVRLTYGYNGNIDKGTSAFITASYLTDAITGLPRAQIQNPGNPELTWEKSRVVNLGFDFAILQRRLTGTVDLYSKRITDLLGNVPVESTSGFTAGLAPPYSYRTNYATMRNDGVDFSINSRNIISKAFSWETSFLFSYVHNELVDYQQSSTNPLDFLTSASGIPREGYSLDAIYSIPWAGLNPDTGDPQFYLDGEVTGDFTKFRDIPLDQLIVHGSSVPIIFGSLNNGIRWHGFSLHATLAFKGNYYFRRESISYNKFLSDNKGHADFHQRWRAAGDELTTDVPSFPSQNNSNRDQVYYHSDILKERADHIRLQQVSFGLDFSEVLSSIIPGIEKAALSLNASNFGVLWAKNSKNVDPEWYNLSVQPSKNYTLRLNLMF